VSDAIGAVAEALRASMKQGRMPFLEVSSNSMAPLLRRGDRVGLVPAQRPQLRLGDVVTYLDNGHLTTHRFWGEAAQQMVSRGDRSSAFDPPWAPDALLGRVVMRRRADRTLALDSGPGERLSRRLYMLARWESRLLQRRLPAPLIRRAIYALALLLAGAASFQQDSA
jgi:hypothetical protein